MIHTKYGGSGLGLFICKSESVARRSLTLGITELLGGRIEMQSKLGEGSGEYCSSTKLIPVFRFFIECETVASHIQADPEATAGTTVISPLATRRTSTTPSGNGDLHLLIIEDNIINQTVLKRQVIKAGLSCEGA